MHFKILSSNFLTVLQRHLRRNRCQKEEKGTRERRERKVSPEVFSPAQLPFFLQMCVLISTMHSLYYGGEYYSKFHWKAGRKYKHEPGIENSLGISPVPTLALVLDKLCDLLSPVLTSGSPIFFILGKHFVVRTCFTSTVNHRRKAKTVYPKENLIEQKKISCACAKNF